MKNEVHYLKYENLQSIAEVLRRKTTVTKSEEEFVELETKTENMRQIIKKSTCFEMYCKTKLNVLNKFLGKQAGRGLDDNATMRVNAVNLPKLEISKSNRDPSKWQSFFELVFSRSW